MLCIKILLQFLNTKINIVYSATAFCVAVTLREQLAFASKCVNAWNPPIFCLETKSALRTSENLPYWSFTSCSFYYCIQNCHLCGLTVPSADGMVCLWYLASQLVQIENILLVFLFKKVFFNNKTKTNNKIWYWHNLSAGMGKKTSSRQLLNIVSI